MPRTPLDPGDRRSILRALAAGTPVRVVARTHQVSPKTVRNIRDARPGPKKGTKKQIAIALRRRRVKKAALRRVTVNGQTVPKFPTADAISKHLGHVSAETVRRDLHAIGFRSKVRPKVPGHGANHVARRLAFCNKILSGPRVYDQIVFTDEKIFSTNETGRRLQWVPPGGAADPRQKTKWGPSVMVWGAIGVGFRALHFFGPGEKCDSAAYTRIIQKFHFTLFNGGFLIQQDNAKPHVSAHTMAYFRDSGLQLFETFPARSPDLSPIENYWAYIAKEAEKLRPTTRAELIAAISRVWGDATDEKVNKFVMSFEKKLKNCKNKGGEY